MKKIIKLDFPVLINAKEVSELSYDPTEITVEQFCLACAKSSAIDKTKSFTFKMRENDYALHLYLGMMAVIAVNPEIDIADLERIKGIDSLKLADVGMLFTLRRLGGASGESNSERPSEHIAEHSVQAQQISKEKD